MRYTIIAAMLVLSHVAVCCVAKADDCNADCNAKCCSSVPTPLGSKSICEPACKTSCEAGKAACKVTGGAIKPPTFDVVVRLYNQSCTSAFDAVTKAIVQAQGFYAAGSDYMINEAKTVLSQRTDLFYPFEFDGVTIRWCQLSSGTNGLAPDANLICLSDSLLNSANHFLTAVTLAHEMRHIRQYRQLGTDNFKCQYAKQFIDCNGCQNNNHPLEKQAYDFENQTVRPAVSKVFNAYQQPPALGAFCSTPQGKFGPFPPQPLGNKCMYGAAYGIITQ